METIIILIILIIIIFAVIYGFSDKKPTNKLPEELFKNAKFLELKGVHIKERKNYILKNVVEEDLLEVYHEVDNQYSDNAIAVNHNGVLIGYFDEYDAQLYLPELKKRHRAIVGSVENYDGYLTLTITFLYNSEFEQ